MIGDKCTRCGSPYKYDAFCTWKWWPWMGWTTRYHQGRFWFCNECLDEILEWWLELTVTMSEPDPSRK